ncbi:MAG: carboxylate--amine ligase [Rhodospirillales bacterium CG15_BIG_FIL_POST_REV_8_21_14_020_66_15]|nr:MAG: carboxylate--amine ligase [Rhodospirillales bacterium CG15_BIG_FIL_POST_REV_8_21_14_020_66_15]
MTPAEIIREARARGLRTLSEHQSKQVLAAYGVPVTRETLAADAGEAARAAGEIGFPVALKGSAPDLAHKTEAGLVEIGLADEAAVRAAATRLMPKLPEGGNLLIQEMASGRREFLIGMTRDAQYGPCITFGLGGIFAEALNDTVLRLAPVSGREALEMMDEIRAAALLGPYRGMPAVDRDALARAVIGVGAAALAHPEIQEIDVNPVIVAGDRPLAVDALVVLASASG